MLSVQLHILPGLLIALGAVLVGMLRRSFDLSRRPMMFCQATVVEKSAARAAFRLFDGQILLLAVEPEGLESLHVGDYGRLTYRAGKFISLERN